MIFPLLVPYRRVVFDGGPASFVMMSSCAESVSHTLPPLRAFPLALTFHDPFHAIRNNFVGSRPGRILSIVLLSSGCIFNSPLICLVNFFSTPQDNPFPPSRSRPFLLPSIRRSEYQSNTYSSHSLGLASTLSNTSHQSRQIDGVCEITPPLNVIFDSVH